MSAPARSCRSAKTSRVSVPVLSKTTVSTPASASSACKRRTSTPRRAIQPALASRAAGVASDRAQGQVTTRMETATISARAGSCGHHPAQAAPAASSTASKKGRAILSARRATPGLLLAACSISATICA